MHPPEIIWHPTAPHLARQIYTLFPFRSFSVEECEGGPVPETCLKVQYSKYRAFIDGFLAYAARTGELDKLTRIEEVPDYESVLADLARTLEDGIADAVKIMPMVVLRRKRRNPAERAAWMRQYMESTEAEEAKEAKGRELIPWSPPAVWEFR